MEENTICPLCYDKNSSYYNSDKFRSYYKCSRCNLIFVHYSQFISAEAEHERYDCHKNNPNDTDYRSYLTRIFQPIDRLIRRKSLGLDFGCGPGPTLSLIFEENGHKVELFDYFYAKNDNVFKKKYDFITATEVLEHLHHPIDEILRLWDCLKPGGIFGIMTGLTTTKEAFTNWHYIRDLTHVCFFSVKTFEYLGDLLNADIIFPSKNIVLFRKNL